MRRMIMVVGVWSVLALIAGCDRGDDPTGDATETQVVDTPADTVVDVPAETPAPAVTWFQDIAPIVIPNCAGCHQDGGIAPFALTNYEEASQLAPLVVDAVESRRMPPGEPSTPRPASRAWVGSTT